MRGLWIIAKVAGVGAAVAAVFSLGALTHDVVKALRCRPDDRLTSYEHADTCPREAWR